MEVKAAPDGVYYADPNLYLRVRGGGKSRLWIFHYSRGGRVRQIGLGNTTARTLKEARSLAVDMQRALRDGKPPESVLGARRGEAVVTFAQYAADYIATKIKPESKREKHVNLWIKSLEDYAYPKIGNKRPREITRDDVLAVLNQPVKDQAKTGTLWATKHDTASRVRNRIERIIGFALDAENLNQANPASLKKLENYLPKARTVRKVKHLPALKWEAVPAFMAELRKRETTSALCLQFAILTAARSGNHRGATWSEVDEVRKVWTIADEKMKGKKGEEEAHEVPLCEDAMKILNAMKLRRVDGCDYIFPGERGGLLSDVAVNKAREAVKKKIGVDYRITVHGFRSSFSDWCAETRRDRDLRELSLSHAINNKVEAAYQRSKLLEQRRELMKAWADYCSGSNNIVHLVQASA